jgi:mannose-1-phosphate guanylyltransferase/mannose-6-phosphate isomerase/mannose-1-phosphate guanylyltransferase/mannose-6-phosphate isomerase
VSEKTPPEAAFRDGIVEDVRPWGKFRRFPHEGASSIKIITVNPGGRLSLQYHNGRDEFWVVLDAGLEITVGERVWTASPDEEVFIPRLSPHRVRNTGDKPARFMEIWIGDSAESDIVRLSDDYHRG